MRFGLASFVSVTLLCLFSTVTVHAASLYGLAVEVKNESEPVLCAEKDNVSLTFTNKEVRSFRIEAAHPVYLSVGMRDNRSGSGRRPENTFPRKRVLTPV
jgi:hypothetical protein